MKLGSGLTYLTNLWQMSNQEWQKGWKCCQRMSEQWGAYWKSCSSPWKTRQGWKEHFQPVQGGQGLAEIDYIKIRVMLTYYVRTKLWYTVIVIYWVNEWQLNCCLWENQITKMLMKLTKIIPSIQNPHFSATSASLSLYHLHAGSVLQFINSN
jgi:hypothetical protein